MNPNRDLPPGHGAEMIFDAGEIPADHREQIRGLRERIVPDREVPMPPIEVAGSDQIAVRQQQRRVCFVSLDACRVDRHHIRPIGEIGDAAEPFRLALGAVDRPGAIEALHTASIGAQHEFCADPSCRGIQRDIELHRLHQPVRRAIVGKSHGTGFFSAH